MGIKGLQVTDRQTKSLRSIDKYCYSGTPMASRNLPPSFFNAHYHAKLAGYSEAKLAYSHPEASGLYSEAYTQGLHHLAAQHASSPDPWQYAAQATATSSYHRSVQVGCDFIARV